MLEKDLIQTRGFHNLYDNGKCIGFTFRVRLTYYRGIFLSQLRPCHVTVDGVTVPREQVVWNFDGRDYTYAQMRENTSVHWGPEKAAKIRIYGKGLEPGYHEIEAGYKYSSSYLPPQLQTTIDEDAPDPFLEGMMGSVRSKRRLLIVW